MKKRIIILLTILFALSFFVKSYQKYQEKVLFQQTVQAEFAPYEEAGKEFLDVIQKIDPKLHQQLLENLKTADPSNPAELDQYMQSLFTILESMLVVRLNQTSSTAFQQFMISNKNVLKEILAQDPSGHICLGVSLGDLDSIKKSTNLINETLRNQKLDSMKAVLLDSTIEQPQYNFTDSEKIEFWNQVLAKVAEKYPSTLFEQMNLPLDGITEKAMVCQFFIDVSQEFIDADDKNLSMETWKIINQQ